MQEPPYKVLTDYDAFEIQTSSSGETIGAHSDDEVELNIFDVLMGIWIPGLISVFGIIGNVLSLWVLSRDPEGSITFTSLKALAVSDLLLLVSALLQQIVPMFCEVNQRTDRFCLWWAGYLRVYTWPVICIAQMASIWMTVLISAERFVAICAPLRAPRPGQKSKIKRIIGLIAVVSVIFNVPRFFEFVPMEEAVAHHRNLTRIVLGETRIRHDPVYRYFYNTALYCLVIYALPLLTLTYLNVRLVRALKTARRNWRFLNTNQKREMKATKLPLVIVTVFFVCGTESLLGFILDAVFVNFQRWLQVYTAVVNVLVILNSAINFLLMFFFGKKFRRMLNDAVRCRRTKASRMKSKVMLSISYKESSL